MISTLRKRLQDLRNLVGHFLINRLLSSRTLTPEKLADFDALKLKIRASDVLLVEGRTQVGKIIQIVTHSRWSHSAICVGKPKDFIQHLDDPTLANDLDPAMVYLLETELGLGTVLSPVDKYINHRVRVCRPKGLTKADQARVSCYTIKRLGNEYNVRQLLDLARFMFPYGILPSRWRSTLFEHNAGSETKVVCSTLIADAFQAVKFPVLPIVSQDDEGNSRLFRRNAKLFAPSDFDISPYFKVLKFPKYKIEPEGGRYYTLPWRTKSDGYSELPWSFDKAPAKKHVELDPSYESLANKLDNAIEVK